MAVNLADALRLLLVTDDDLLNAADPFPVLHEAIAGGVTAVQLRFKRVADGPLLALARRGVAELPVPVFVNDRLDIALLAGAAGVHLGADDLPPAIARRIAPPGFVIGASVGTEEEILRGAAADYWGVGPLHATGTKSDAGPALDFDGVSRYVMAAGGRPCVVIGGVRPDDVAPARRLGVAGVAVVRGILAEPDVRRAARRYGDAG
jgi:thiamine-phosphate pyrophosphorylase